MITNKNLCLSIANQSFNACKSWLKQVELAELRLDLLDFTNVELAELLSLDTSIVATCRFGNKSIPNRKEILKLAIDLGVDYIDIELDANPDFVSEILQYAKQKSCKVILSYHNFERTPGADQLQNIIEEAQLKRPDYIKLATLTQTKEDNDNILKLYENYDHLIAFGMGEFGRTTRIDCLKLGAEFTYVAGKAGAETATGQYTYKEMREILELN